MIDNLVFAVIVIGGGFLISSFLATRKWAAMQNEAMAAYQVQTQEHKDTMQEVLSNSRRSLELEAQMVELLKKIAEK